MQKSNTNKNSNPQWKENIHQNVRPSFPAINSFISGDYNLLCWSIQIFWSRTFLASLPRHVHDRLRGGMVEDAIVHPELSES